MTSMPDTIPPTQMLRETAEAPDVVALLARDDTPSPLLQQTTFFLGTEVVPVQAPGVTVAEEGSPLRHERPSVGPRQQGRGFDWQG